MSRNRLFNTEYCVLQGFFWMAFCTVVSYAALFLQRRGYSGTETGLVMAFGSILALILQPTVADLADRSRRVNLMGIISVIAAVMICGMATAWLVAGRSAAVCISYGLYFCCVYLMLPFVNAFAGFLNTWKLNINFGIARGIGSLTYALLSLALGRLIEKMGPNVLSAAGILFTLCVLLMMALFSRQYASAPVAFSSADKDKSQSLFRFLKGEPRFALLLVGIALTYFSHSAFTNFLINVVENVGGGSAEMGVCSFIAAIVELPPMFLFMRLLHRVRCSSLLKLSCVMFSVKMLACWLAPNVNVLYLAQVIQMCAFGLYIPASVQYVNEVISPADRVKGQALVTSTTSLSAIAASFLSGIMLDNLGASATMLVSAIISATGALIVLPAVKKTDIHIK
ncbi:MAG: MFS transporter [Oscillospiraceae bacterium]|nr:MFS transporter [Oscillospiraceae bacterium]